MQVKQFFIQNKITPNHEYKFDGVHGITPAKNNIFLNKVPTPTNFNPRPTTVRYFHKR